MVAVSDNENRSMDDVVDESISALLDDEANDLDLLRVLKHAESDGSVREKWQRFHMASSLLRKDRATTISLDISEHVRRAVESEPALRRPQAGNSWVTLLAKSGIAASVAFGFLFGVQQFTGQQAAQEADLAEGKALVAPDLNSAVIPAGFQSPTLTTRTVSTGQNRAIVSDPGANVRSLKTSEPSMADAELQAHFDRLMMIHAQQVSQNSDLGVMSFARLTDLADEKLSDERDTPKASAQ